MRAAVITLHQVYDYGTQLRQYFDDVVFIDYRRLDTYDLGLMRTFSKDNPLKIPLILPMKYTQRTAWLRKLHPYSRSHIMYVAIILA
jgi:hypothetical protein